MLDRKFTRRRLAGTTRRRIATAAPRTGFEPARGVPASPGLVVPVHGGYANFRSSIQAGDDTSRTMGATSRERYAVVSCHVERPLDDAVWARFALLQDEQPGGFAITALVRPVDTEAGEDERAWVRRATDAASRAPLGHHTHWTAPDHARPTSAATGARVLEEGRALREHGLKPTLFCGGGWYTDVEVAEACAELGYVDCTLRARRPPYLPAGERWATLAAPAVVELPSGRTLGAMPTTHSLGDLARSLARRELPPVAHVYFHDTDLLDRRRRTLLGVVLRLLARRADVSDLDTLSARLLPDAPRVTWDDVARL